MMQDDDQEVVPFGDEARVAKEKHAKLLEHLEQQKKARTIALPTDDALIKARLRELSEPVMFFGESKAERRERLRKKLVERADERGMPLIDLNFKPITVSQEKPKQTAEDLVNQYFRSSINIFSILCFECSKRSSFISRAKRSSFQ